MAKNLLDRQKGNYLVYNHNIVNYEPDIVKKVQQHEYETSYYEVIRFIENIPLFFEDHMERLTKSAFPTTVDIKRIRQDIEILTGKENVRFGNIKIVITSGMVLIYISEHYYPSFDEYEKGVRTGILKYERPDPNSKIIRDDYKKAIGAKIKTPGPFGDYFEVLLVDSSGNITEGSRSNVFFTSGNTIYTPPENIVLKGVTRKYVIKAIKNISANLVTRCITPDEISRICDGGFLTGTSINVLPVFSVEDTVLNSGHNSLIRRIGEEYNHILQNYISEKKAMSGPELFNK